VCGVSGPGRDAGAQAVARESLSLVLAAAEDTPLPLPLLQVVWPDGDAAAAAFAGHGGGGAALPARGVVVVVFANCSAPGCALRLRDGGGDDGDDGDAEANEEDAWLGLPAMRATALGASALRVEGTVAAVNRWLKRGPVAYTAPRDFFSVRDGVDAVTFAAGPAPEARSEQVITSTRRWEVARRRTLLKPLRTHVRSAAHR
jgi:hypothetical protein